MQENNGETGRDLYSLRLFYDLQRDIPILGRSMPFNLALKIFSYLDTRSLCRACRVCKSWKALGENDRLWQDLVKLRWKINEKEQIKNWKKSYQSKMRVFNHDQIKHGAGIYTYRNGNTYEGEWENNQRHGYGRMIYNAKATALDFYIESYEGEWKRGNKSGWGRYIWNNGDRYEGEFVDGKREGRGTMFLTNGDRYEGEWKDGQLNGKGRAIKSCGYIYEGELVNGDKDGLGNINFENGCKYAGGWTEGRKNGYGKDIEANSEVWEGEYINGKRKEKVLILRDAQDWKDHPMDEQRLRDRRHRRKKVASYSTTNKKRRRKKPPFVMPEK